MSAKVLDQPTPGLFQYVGFIGLTAGTTNYAPDPDYSIAFAPAKKIEFRGSGERFVESKQTEASPDDITFQLLAIIWRNDTGHYSIFEQKVLHPAYQEIIGMGEKALPSLINALNYKPSHWFWALRAIAREDPAKDAKTVDQAVQYWRKWWANRRLRAYGRVDFYR